MVGRDVLARAFRTRSGVAGAEDRERRIAVSFRTVARLFNVAEDLIVSPVLFDDVDDVLDRRAGRKETRLAWSKQTVVAHYLLRVARERRIVGKIHGADVADDERHAVLTTLPAGATGSGWKAFVWSIRHAAGVVDDHRRVLNAGAFAVADEDCF